MDRASDRYEGQYELAPSNYAMKRLEKLKGKIWALTLDEAEKYFEMAEFADVSDEEMEREIQKIKQHLQRRIEKLTKREMFQQAETQNRMRLQIMERELDRMRTSRQWHSKVSNSLITLRDLEGAIGGWKDLPTDRIPETERPLKEQLSISVAEEIEKGVQTEFQHPTYNEIYHNINELKSTENTQADYDLDYESEEQKQTCQEQEKLSIKKRVYKRCYENVNWIAAKIKDLKHLLWD